MAVVTGVRVEMWSLAQARAGWDRLSAELDISPFLRPAWFEAWQASFAGRDLSVVTAQTSDELVGVLPLLRGRVGYRSPSNWHTPEFAVVASTDAARRALVLAALERSRWNVQLRFVDEGTADEVAELARERGRAVAVRVLERSPYIDVHGAFEDYLAAQLPRRARAELRRRRRRLGDRGDVSLEVHEEFTPARFAAFLDVEGSGWKARQGTAVATDPAARTFYTSVARWAGENGWLRLGLLRVGDAVVAGDLAVEHAGVHSLLKTGYDPALRSYGPGKLLRHDMVQHAFDSGVRTYDFLGADAEWKREWTSTTSPRLSVQVFGPRQAGRLMRTADVHARRLRGAIVEASGRWRHR